jgi:LysR family glycine cleavage system transcriptional activator
VRAFEAAGRHLSFTRAAEELHVTPAAVSQQVRSLEQRLGVPLFRRVGRGLRLTEAGQAYLTEVRAALDRLAAATERLYAADGAGVITVSVLPSFAAKWLVTRLWKFHEAHPELSVRLSASDALVDFEREDVDLAIRYGPGHWSGLLADLLMREEVFPVCAPALLEGAGALREPADLARYSLLEDHNTLERWDDWLRAAGSDEPSARGGPSFSHASLMVQAAVEGQGVALARSQLVADDLAAGRLVRPFALSLPARYAYYVVSPEAHARRSKVAAFRRWILEEARAADGDAVQPADSAMRRPPPA